MKRSAAIIGPTPAFLRWTLVVPCPFRDLESPDPTNAAFRDLRSLRTIAVGEFENRIVDEICVHPDSANGETKEAKGFPVEEVYAAYGGTQSANATCMGCTANVPISASELDGDAAFSKAGCFGWLPFGENVDQTDSFSRLMVSGGNESAEIIEKFETAFQSIGEQSIDEPAFPKTTPAWYGVWSTREFSDEQLELLRRVFQKVDSNSIAWRRLVRAIDLAYEKKLRFACALTPPGISDGVHWTIESHCVACGFARTEAHCPACCDNSPPQPSRRMKVLGLRPYLNLTSIVGEVATAAIVQSYRQRVANRQSRNEPD